MVGHGTATLNVALDHLDNRLNSDTICSYVSRLPATGRLKRVIQYCIDTVGSRRTKT